MKYRRHHEARVSISAPPESVFAYVDDHSRFSSHMSQSSWMMGGGRMSVELDEARGQAVGSHIRLTGRVLGLQLFLDEVVTVRQPPSVKVWETVGLPRLLVIGPYRMGIGITPDSSGSVFRVFIDYELPYGSMAHWLGYLFGGLYAKWCVKQMLRGATEHFGTGVRLAA